MFLSEYLYIVPIISGVATLLISGLVFMSGWRVPQGRVLALFSLVLSGWLFVSSYMIEHCSEESYAIFIDRIIYVVVSAIPAVVFHFSSIYTKKGNRRPWIAIGYLLMVLFWFLAWSPYFIDGLYIFTNGCHSQAKILHHFFLLYFMGFSIFAVINDLFLFYKKEPIGEKKRQHQFVFLAIAAQLILGLSGFLPAYNINSFTFSYFSGLVTTLILIYAMFRHNLLNLKVFAINIFITFVIVVSLFQLYLAESFTLKLINIVVFVLIVILGFLVRQNVKEEVISREKGERLARYLANANARLRELDKQKTEFVSIASHQLRSPIAAIKGYTSMITEGSFGEVPKNLNEPLDRILESGQRIGVMVDDLLNVTRIEQGRMTYNMAPQNAYNLINSVINELKMMAEKKGLEILITPDSNQQCFVKADEGKLKQIFSNLIDNAVKYTPRGWVHITVSKMEQEKKVLIKIQDTGIGIAPDEVQNLFQKFNRASNANEVNVLGTGLGLYIAREILKAHDGWINVESSGIGKGSTFVVELPACEENLLPTKEEK
jgi:signal transduction histidine kinase